MTDMSSPLLCDLVIVKHKVPAGLERVFTGVETRNFDISDMT